MKIITRELPKELPKSKIMPISNNISEVDDIFNSEMPIQEKIEKLQDIINVKKAKIKDLRQPAAQTRCIEAIEDAKKYLNILTSSSDDNDVFLDEEDEDDDMDVFDIITLNAKQVALKRSNSLIVTGDAGVGKTSTVIEAVKFLNPEETTKSDKKVTASNDELNPNWVFSSENNEIETELENIEDENFQASESDEDVVVITDVETEIATEKIIEKKSPPKINNIVDEEKTQRNNNSGYFRVSGSCTAAALYELLWVHRHRLLIFDDFDSVLKDSDCIDLLKAALDTYPVREIAKMTKGNSFDSYGMTEDEMWEEYEMTGKVPNQFKFYGYIIFISNIHEDKFDKALISRSLHVEVNLTRDQVINRMKKLLLSIYPEVELDYKYEALEYLDFLTSRYACKFSLNLRELIHAISYKSSYPNDIIMTKNNKEVFIWKQLLKRRIIKQKPKY